MAALSIGLFGNLRVTVDSRAARLAAPRKAVSLLAYLLLHGGERSRDTVAYELWPDHPENLARANLRRHSLLLQRALPPLDVPYVLSDRKAISWNPDVDCHVDVRAFETYSMTASTIPLAVDLYTGDLLPNLDDEWLFPIRDRFRERHILNLIAHARAVREHGDPRRSLSIIENCLELDSWREEAIREKMLSHVELGDRAKALDVFSDFAKRLAVELQALPAGATQQLKERIMAEEPQISPARVLPRRPESTFLGRAQAMEGLAKSLEARGLVTLVGPAGVGKTRLAVECALAQEDRYPDGIVMVDLAAVADPTLAQRAVAVSMDLTEGAESDPIATVASVIKNRRMLLLVDNCEHVIDEIAPLCDELRNACPRLRILATSREPLVADDECVVFVEPLELEHAPGSATNRSPAAQLFWDRAADQGRTLRQRDEAEVSSICRKLDGLPLAIEIAAARFRTLDLKTIARGLDDRIAFLHGGPRTRGSRQKALGAAITWSYDLLSADERRVFLSAGAFRGTFSLGAAAAVAGFEAAEALAVVADIMSSLVNKSMIMAVSDGGSTRYRLLETMRVYALDRLSPVEASAVFHRHAECFATLALDLKASYLTESDDVCLALFAPDRDNLEAAIDWASRSREHIALAGIIGAALIDYWLVTGQEAFAVKTLEALSHSFSLQTMVGRDVHCALAYAYRRSYRFSAAVSALKGAIAHYRAANESRGLCRALTILGTCSLQIRETAEDSTAMAMLTEALDLAGRTKDHYYRAEVLYVLSVVAAYRAHASEMIRLSDDALTLFETLGKSIRARHVRIHRAVSLFQFGDIESARSEAECASKAANGPLHPVERAVIAELDGWLARDEQTACGRFVEALRLSIELDQEPLINARLANFVIVSPESGVASLSAQLFGYLAQRELEGTLNLHPFLRKRLFSKGAELRRSIGHAFDAIAAQGACADWPELQILLSRYY